MWDAAVEMAAAVERALTALGEALAGVSPGWLVLGVALHLANQVLRGRGWFVIVRLATPGEPSLRARDAVAAWVAGAGAGRRGVGPRWRRGARTAAVAHDAPLRLPAAGGDARGRRRR
jgi:hypothetical protein